MTNTIAPPAGPAKSLPVRLMGVVFTPRATYADVAAHPRWLGALATVVMIGAALTFLFLSTDIGKQAMLEQQLKFMESFGMKISDTMYKQMEERLGRAPLTSALAQAVSLPIVAAIVAGIALGIFGAIMGGNATFKQVFAIVTHSGVVIALAQMFGLPLAYARETMSSATNLAVFLPFLDENSFLARLFGSIDLFQIWWIISLSIGLGVLYRKRTGPIAIGLLSAYVVIVLIIAAVRTALSGA